MKPSEPIPRKRKFIRVLDGRKQPVRGLWKRGELYYAQLVQNGRQIKERLEAQTDAQAIAALNTLKVRRSEGKLKIVRHAPKLADAIEEYKASSVFLSKREATRKNETTYFKAWKERLGERRVDRISTTDIIAVRDDLLADKAVGGSEEAVTKRTANLYVTALRQVFKYLEDRAKLAEVPRVKSLKTPPPPKRALLSDEECRRLLDACTSEEVCRKNGQLLSCYLRFLMLSGGREQESYRVQWKDVDLDRGLLTFGADGLAKNHRFRTLHMGPELLDLLQEMVKTRQPDSSYLFPSPQRGKKDICVRTFKQSFAKVCEAAKLPHLGFHDFRHLFISKCVMAGVDFMTIASWVGHRDGGVLIGKVYGHLSDHHKATTAKRLVFFERPANVVDLPEATGT
jgi:integrase